MSVAVTRTCTELVPDSTGDPKPLSEFKSVPAYVLLGDPGAGKTTEFTRASEALGADALMLKARDFVTFDVDLHPEWDDKVLFIDGLDEMRAGSTDSRVPLNEIRKRLDQLGKPHFRISCREADWLGNNDQQRLKEVSPDSEITALRLDPLSREAVDKLLSLWLADGEVQEAEVTARFPILTTDFARFCWRVFTQPNFNQHRYGDMSCLATGTPLAAVSGSSGITPSWSNPRTNMWLNCLTPSGKTPLVWSRC